MLDLGDLSKGRPAITPAYGQYLAEAGGVCLESQGHEQGIVLSVVGYAPKQHAITWPEVTDQVTRCHNDPEVATEHGAVGVAVLLAQDVVGYSVIERSRKGTGFDWWLGENDGLPFQNMARMEVSGIREGTDNQVSARVKQKLSQVTPSDETGLPAYVVVVEFSQPLAEVRKK